MIKKNKPFKVSFLGLAKPKKIDEVPRKNTSSYPFLSAKPSKNKIPHMAGGADSVLFPQDSKKLIKQYGDNDYDGSPNKFDCSPNHPGKDGFFSDLMDKVRAKRAEQKQQSSINYDAEGAENNKKLESLKRQASVMNNPATREQFENEKVLPLAKELKAKAYNRYQTAIQTRNRIREKQQYDKALSDLRFSQTSAGKAVKVGGRLKKVLTSSPRTIYGKQGLRVRLSRQKVLKARFQGALEAAGVTGTYGKNTGRKGRPKGTVRYNIPGVGPVGVYEFRKWLSSRNKAMKLEQKRLLLEAQQAAKMQSNQQEPVQSPQEVQALYEQAAGIPVEQQSQVQYQGDYNTQQVQADQQMNSGQPVNRYEQQLLQLQQQERQLQQNPYQQQTVQQKSLQGTNYGKTDGSILDAPNLFSAAANQVNEGSMNILNAPNINKGEMQRRPDMRTQSVNVGERPTTNPHGNTYTDINLMNGKTILKRRITERFETGEAL